MTTTPRPRAATLAAAALLTVGALAGCGNGLSSTHRSSADPAITAGAARTPTPARSPHTATPSRSAHNTTPSRSAPPAAPTSPSTTMPTGTVTAPHRSRVCSPGDLAVGLRTPRGGGTAGSQYELITFRNISSRTCTMNGHPGVSFVGKGNGTQLGVPAARTGAVHTVRVAPGRSATALLQIVDAGNYDPAACAPTTSDGFRVYPPDWRVSVFVPFRTQACQLDPGTSPQLTVSPVD